MSTIEVIALSGFDHDGRRRCGDTFRVSQVQALALKKSGLVRLSTDPAPANPGTPGPTPAAGSKPSASPAAQASPKQTAKPRAGGAKTGKVVESAEPSLSPIPPSADAPGPTSSTDSTSPGGEST